MRLVLIGGGHYGNIDDKPYDLKEIDERIVSLSAKPHPRLLFVGFNEKSNYMFSFIKKNFMAIGAQCEHLRHNDFLNQKTVEGCFKRADIIYLGGGNTILYMQQIRKFGLDKYIVSCANQNKILVGISAGAIICSSFGSSDSLHFKDKEKFACVKGLGLVDFIFVPHYSSSSRPDDMPRFMKNKKSKIAVCCDDCSALIIDNENFEVVKSNSNATTRKIYIKDGKLTEKELDLVGNIHQLLLKQ